MKQLDENLSKVTERLIVHANHLTTEQAGSARRRGWF
jgi:hypothetical protein